MNRRNWLRTAAGLLVAPAVVRAESIMRVRPVLPTIVGVDLAFGSDFTVVLDLAAVSRALPGIVSVTLANVAAHQGWAPGDLLTVGGALYRVRGTRRVPRA